jgi:1,4-dihydroxy-2-naphthoate polyprenyltransferase
MGLLAVAVLEANNIRDIPTDALAGKRTLAVRIGDRAARALYATLVIGAFLVIGWGVLVYLLNDQIGLIQWGLFGLAAWPLAVRPLEIVRRATGRDLIPVLTGTAAVHAACGLLMALGLLLSWTV